MKIKMHTKEKTLVESLRLLIDKTSNDKIDNLINGKNNDLIESLKVLFEIKNDDEKESQKDQGSNEDIQEPPEENIPEESQEENTENIPPQQNPPEENTEDQYQNDTDMEGENEFQDDTGMEGETTLEDVGKMYELKQIHYRLIAVRNHLEIFVEEEFDEVKNVLTKAITLFDLVINNYDKYKEKIDEIIIMYYKFIQDVYELTKKKYKKYVNKHKKKNAGL